jgi:hypothetical protein
MQSWTSDLSFKRNPMTAQSVSAAPPFENPLRGIVTCSGLGVALIEDSNEQRYGE